MSSRRFQEYVNFVRGSVLPALINYGNRRGGGLRSGHGILLLNTGRDCSSLVRKIRGVKDDVLPYGGVDGSNCGESMRDR